MLADAAVRLSLAASLAYLPAKNLATGASCSDYAQRLSPSYSFAQQVTVDDLAASATVFDGADGGCLVAFRGSTELRNYASMFNLLLTDSRLDGGGGGRVHRGYQEASLRLYDKLSPVLATRAPEQTIFVGHSYGGGTATSAWFASLTRKT